MGAEGYRVAASVGSVSPCCDASTDESRIVAVGTRWSMPETFLRGISTVKWARRPSRCYLGGRTYGLVALRSRVSPEPTSFVRSGGTRLVQESRSISPCGTRARRRLLADLLGQQPVPVQRGVLVDRHRRLGGVAIAGLELGRSGAMLVVSTRCGAGGGP